jgi:NhaA family Na+:H+ antiporter
MRINLNVFQRFLRTGSGGSQVLLLSLVGSLILANTSAADSFQQLLGLELGLFTLTGWINDALMSIFFLLVGLEIKRELVEGELASIKRASLPVLAAFGGAVTPAIIYYALNRNTASETGWGIPMATDIAFALAALSILGKRIPPALKVFLAALAIADDLIAILVIAIFYSTKLEALYLLYAAGILALLFTFNRVGVKRLIFYLIPGVALWLCVHHSGVHATIAGVLLAITLPTTPGADESPLEKLECALTKPVNFLILPLFALANTAIHFEPQMLQGLSSELSLGIITGLVFGKPAGICLTSLLAISAGVARLPAKTSWRQLLGAGVLGGIGFTMSTFIALLSFSDHLIQENAKFAVLIASVTAALIGISILALPGRKPGMRRIPQPQPEEGRVSGES